MFPLNNYIIYGRGCIDVCNDTGTNTNGYFSPGIYCCNTNNCNNQISTTNTTSTTTTSTTTTSTLAKNCENKMNSLSMKLLLLFPILIFTKNFLI